MHATNNVEETDITNATSEGTTSYGTVQVNPPHQSSVHIDKYTQPVKTNSNDDNNTTAKMVSTHRHALNFLLMISTNKHIPIITILLHLIQILTKEQ